MSQRFDGNYRAFIDGVLSGNVPATRLDDTNGYWDHAGVANMSSFGNDAAAMNAALASGKKHVFFPPLTYAVNGHVVGSESRQVVEFAPGAVLRVAPTGSVTFGGDHQRILAPAFETVDTGSDETFAPLLTLAGSYMRVSDVSFEGGGRSLFPDGVVRIDGRNNVLEYPDIIATGARYGIYRNDLSEFLVIIGGRIQGRNNGTFAADSEGIFCGNFAGQLKMSGTSVIGWTQGVGIHGSHDAPNFFGCTFVNNQKHAILVDLPGAGGVRGLTVSGGYFSDQIGQGFLHFRRGLCEGWCVSGAEFGYQEIGILVDDEFGTLEGGVVQACFIQGGIEGAPPIATMRPGANSSNTLFINNKRQSAGTLGTGAYAARAVELEF